MLNLKRKSQILIAIVLCSFVLVPISMIPSARADNQYIRHINVRGNFDACNWWWIFYIERLDVQMWIGADLWYSDYLDGWFLKDAVWYFPEIWTDTLYGYHFYVDYIDCSQVVAYGNIIIEVSQTIHGKLYVGSSYRWVTLELVLTPGNGNGAHSTSITLGSGNLNMDWHHSSFDIGVILDAAWQEYPGDFPPT